MDCILHVKKHCSSPMQTLSEPWKTGPGKSSKIGGPGGRGCTYRQRLFDGLLDFHPLASNGLVQLPLKCQEIHVCLRLWDKFPNL